MGYQTMSLKGDGAQIFSFIFKMGYEIVSYSVKSSTQVPTIQNDRSLQEFG